MNIVIFLLTTLQLVTFLPANDGCIELLSGQWSQMSVEERAERAEIVVVIRILRRRPLESKKQRFYSANCEILDVLKGWEHFNKNSSSENGWVDRKTIDVHGFGNALDCLSDIQENRVYLLFGMFKVDLNLWASYFTSFGAVEELSAEVYDKVTLVLGLHKWSSWTPCSQICNGGEKQITRTCVQSSHCDYSWSSVKRKCNWQNCNKILLSSIDFQTKNSVYLKTFLPADSEKMIISIKFKNSHQKHSKEKQSFVFSMIDGKGTIVTLTVTDNGITQIDSQKITQNERFSKSIMSQVLNEEIVFHVSINITDIVFENDCDRRPKKNMEAFLRNFFSDRNSRITWKMITNADISLSNESIEDYLKKSCMSTQYNHSSKFNLMLQEERKKSMQNMSKISINMSPEWQSWSSCSVTCGIGWQKRERDCINEECETGKKKFEIKTCFLKEMCPDIKCRQQCQNGGQCLNGKCFCENGYHGVFCESPICLDQCQHNGVCISPNQCQCVEGFEGRSCEFAKCNIKCLNGGQCLFPNVCTCPYGFEGHFCQNRKCSPACQNGGDCQLNNFCKCPPGVIGSRCEKFECYPQCMNGGTCIGIAKCQCPTGFSGTYCEKHICETCFNGGKCLEDACHCTLGYYGDQCQSQVCVTGLKFRKIIKPVMVNFPGTVNNKICIDSNCKLIRPQRSVIVNKVIFKPYIDCL